MAIAQNLAFLDRELALSDKHAHVMFLKNHISPFSGKIKEKKTPEFQRPPGLLEWTGRRARRAGAAPR